jgi:hypothetical protein
MALPLRFFASEVHPSVFLRPSPDTAAMEVSGRTPDPTGRRNPMIEFIIHPVMQRMHTRREHQQSGRER